MYTVKAYQWSGGKPGRFLTFRGKPVDINHHAIPDSIRLAFKEACEQIKGRSFPVRRTDEDGNVLDKALSVAVDVAEIGPDGAITMLSGKPAVTKGKKASKAPKGASRSDLSAMLADIQRRLAEMDGD